MYYIDWKIGKEIEGWKELDLSRLITEVSKDGVVLKEIGIGKNGLITQAFPSNKYKYGEYGMWDNVKIEAQFLRNDISELEFYSIWNKIKK